MTNSFFLFISTFKRIGKIIQILPQDSTVSISFECPELTLEMPWILRQEFSQLQDRGKYLFTYSGIPNVAGSQIELHLNGVLMWTAFSNSSTSWALSNCNCLPFLILVFIIQFFYSIYRLREEIARSGLTSFREQLRNFTEIFVYIPQGSGKFTFSPPERIVRSMARKESRRCQLWYPQVIWFSYFVLV